MKMRFGLAALLLLSVSMTPALAVDNSTLPVCGTCAASEVFANKDVGGIKFPKSIPYNSSGTELFTSSNPAQVTGANGTFPATQSGTWTVQPGNTANTTPWLVTGTGGTFPATQSGTWNVTNISGTVSLPTGASTSANQTTINTNLGPTSDAACAGGGSACSVNARLAHLENLAAGAIPAGSAYIGQVGLNAVAAGGWTPSFFIAANSNNATSLKGSAGIVHAAQVYGVGSAPAYLKLYDKATAPTCGTDTPVKVVMIPAASTAANGAGAIGTVIDAQFSTGIGYCVVTGIANNDNTSVAAATFAVNIDWK